MHPALLIRLARVDLRNGPRILVIASGFRPTRVSFSHRLLRPNSSASTSPAAP
jgi:hypothetical protein